MNLSNHENDENLAFSQTFQFLPNFRFLQKSQWQKFRSTHNNAIYAKKIVPGLNRFCSGHLQNTPNIKTFFGYAVNCIIIIINIFHTVVDINSSHVYFHSQKY